MPQHVPASQHSGPTTEPSPHPGSTRDSSGGPTTSGDRSPKRTPSKLVRVFLPALLIVFWVAVFGGGGPQFAALSEVTSNEATDFLPASADSTQVQNRLGDFVGKKAAPAIVVITGKDGAKVDPAQLQKLPDALASAVKETATAEAAEKGAGDGAAPPDVQASPVTASEDGKAAQIVVLIPQSVDVSKAVDAMDGVLDAQTPPGAQSWVTGPAGFAADLTKGFAGIDGILLLVALLTVLVILVIVYRSPVLPFLVLLSSLTALCAAVAVNVGLVKSGLLSVNGQAQGILFILVIGAATDYCLLYTARYREELRIRRTTWEATRAAWKGTWEPIVASAGTVIAGLLCLMLSDLSSNASLGPVAAVGIVSAVAVALTFLPAMLMLGGRKMFWPKAPAYDDAAAARAHQHLAPERQGVWGRVAAMVRRRPRPIAAGVALLLALGCAGLTAFDTTPVPLSDVVLGQSNARDGQKALQEHFPGGSGSPTYVLVPSGQASEAARIVLETDGVESVAVTARDSVTGFIPLGPDGNPVTVAPFTGAKPTVAGGDELLQATLSDASDSQAAEDTVLRLRERVEPIDGALVGGPTATTVDTNITSTHDRNFIIPLVLAAITLMLMLLLRSLVAPLLLLATTVLSFGFALGVSGIIFRLVGLEGSDPSVVLFAFVFLVALGIDYNIFLMTRVREESLQHGTQEGTTRGLVTTGGVITSAGVVLAATFAALTVIPIQFLVQLAIIVSFGVLVDALVVRSLLVPALAHIVGDRIWWPAKVPAPGRDVRSGAHDAQAPAQT